MDINSIIIIVIALIVVALIIAAVAFFVYKAGFRWTEAEINTGLFKGKAVRSSTDTATELSTKPATPSGTKARQTAEDGGKVTNSTIKAPADSGADLGQEAKGRGSRIDDSTIGLS